MPTAKSDRAFALFLRVDRALNVAAVLCVLIVTMALLDQFGVFSRGERVSPPTMSAALQGIDHLLVSLGGLSICALVNCASPEPLVVCIQLIAPLWVALVSLVLAGRPMGSLVWCFWRTSARAIAKKLRAALALKRDKLSRRISPNNHRRFL